MADKKPKGGKREGSGRKPFVPTDEQRKQVAFLVGAGNTHENIAIFLNIPLGTLEKHFKQEIKAGKPTVDGAIQNKMYQKCMEGDSTMLIWWSKCRLRWSGPAEERKIGGLEGAPPVKQELSASPELLKPFSEDEVRAVGGLPPKKKKK